MSATEAKRKLRAFGRSGGNWRLKGLYLAGLPTTRVSAKDVAKAWPTGNTSDYRFLSESQRNSATTGPERYLSLDENSEGYRRLSDATKEADWQDAGMGEKAIHLDRGIRRALAFGDSIEEFDTLFQDQLMDTVIEGARKKQIARDAATVINVDRRNGTHPRGQGPAFARKVQEGAAIRDDNEDYDNQVTWSTTKFGEGARATEELIEQAQIDYIERQIEWLGRQCENAVNRVWLTELIDNADPNNDVDTSAESDRDISSVNASITNIDLADFEADTLVTHPRYRKTLFDSDNLVYSNRAGSDEGLRNRTYNPLFDLEMVNASNGMLDPDSPNTWDFDSAGEFGGVVYNRDLIGIYMYSDIEVKDYEDPIRDLEGVNARINVDANYHQPASASRLTY